MHDDKFRDCLKFIAETVSSFNKFNEISFRRAVIDHVRIILTYIINILLCCSVNTLVSIPYYLIKLPYKFI
jgi:hypothetical protein